MSKTAHFFVDEAGDLNLFGRRGKSLLGTEGVSWCFMVGLTHITAPDILESELEALRRELLADRYLQAIPSMRPEARKTAICFHAKDDCPEVRREVFRTLARHEIKVQVGIRRKNVLMEEARAKQSKGGTWNANTVYDDIVKTLFKRALHRADSNIVVFARRGKSSRKEALRNAIQKAQLNFQRDTGEASDRPTQVIPSTPSETAGLQATDHFLWALQRMYEREEDRYFEFLREHYRLIMDFDDKRAGTSYGRWYSDQDPLSRQKMMPVTG
jgi:deoxyribodipyrimidine photolyase